MYFVASRWVACSRARLRRGIINPKTVKQEKGENGRSCTVKKKKKKKEKPNRKNMVSKRGRPKGLDPTRAKLMMWGGADI